MSEPTQEHPHVATGDALLVVDVQNDFLPGGALPVPDGDRIIAPLKEYIQCFRNKKLPIFASRDWHPANHTSFKAQGGPWPSHCVQDSQGAEFAKDIELPEDTIVISTGYKPDLEGYSAFEATDLDEHLKKANTKRLFVGGLATDYCVFHTVKEACQLGYTVWLLLDASGAINRKPEDGSHAIEKMQALGTQIFSGALS